MLDIACGLQMTGGIHVVSVVCRAYAVVKAAGGWEGDINWGREF